MNKSTKFHVVFGKLMGVIVVLVVVVLVAVVGTGWLSCNHSRWRVNGLQGGRRARARGTCAAGRAAHCRRGRVQLVVVAKLGLELRALRRHAVELNELPGKQLGDRRKAVEHEIFLLYRLP